jgi:hypothetical protein
MVLVNAAGLASDESSASGIPISSPEDFAKIGNDAAFPLNENYVQTQDIDFTDKDMNGGYDVSITASASGQNVVFTIDFGDTVTSSSVNAWHVNGETITTDASSGGRTADITAPGTEGKSILYLAGLADTIPFAIVLDVTDADDSFIAVGSSNGNMDPIPGTFTGTYDGGGHRIIGLETNVAGDSDTTSAAPFLSVGPGAVIRDVVFEGGSSFAYNYAAGGASGVSAGGIAVSVAGSGTDGAQVINACNANSIGGVMMAPGNIGQEVHVGGISASAGHAGITGSCNSGTVLGYSPASSETGICGAMAAGLTAVTGNGRGLSVDGSYNSGSVYVRSGSGAAGGLVAYAEDGLLTISGSFNVGDVRFETGDYLDGNRNIYAGGLLGRASASLPQGAEPGIRNSFNAGNITVDGGNVTNGTAGTGGGFTVGGLASSLIGNDQNDIWVSVTGSYNSGDIHVRTSKPVHRPIIGGIAGQIHCIMEIGSCYNTGFIMTEGQRKDAWVGGVLGEVSGVAPDSPGIRKAYNYGYIDTGTENNRHPGGMLGALNVHHSNNELIITSTAYAISNENIASPTSSGGECNYGIVGIKYASAHNPAISDSYRFLKSDESWPYIASDQAQILDGPEWSSYLPDDGYTGFILPHLTTIDNNIVVSLESDSGTSAPDDLTWTVSGDYDPSHPLEGHLAWADGSAPTDPGDYSVIKGTVGDEGAPPSGRYYQLAFLLKDYTLLQNEYSIAVTVSPAGAGTVEWAAGTVTGDTASAGTVSVNDGDRISFAQSAHEGYTFIHWLVDGVRDTSPTLGPLQITADVTVEAVFEKTSPPGSGYTITATADGGSTITPNGTVSVVPGESTVFAFSAAEGHRIVAVYVDGDAIPPSAAASGEYTFTDVREDHTISVVSEADAGYITLTIEIVGGEGVPEYRIGPSGQNIAFTRSQIIAVNSDLYVSIVADEGYRFSGWTGEVESNHPELHFPRVDRDIYLAAHVELDIGAMGAIGNGEWAVLNLIFAVLAVFAGIFAMIMNRDRPGRYGGGKRSGSSVILSIGALAIGIAAAAVFFLTEDLSSPAAATDGWTLLMSILLVAAVVLALAGSRLGRDRGEDTEIRDRI